jgi:cobalamin biosynthesis protein CobC
VSGEPEHGGGVDGIAERYGIPRDRWLDLSTGINPNPYPLPDLAREYWHRLPDAALDAWLRETAAARYGAPDAGRVVPAPGSQAIIQWLPRLLPTAKVAVVGPTYREHRCCWAAAGHAVAEIAAVEQVPEDAGVLVLANPNNPDGRIVDPDRLLSLAGNRLLVVDEAFADLAPEISLARHAGRPDLVVLRSFGKFFGLAGIRLGFALLGEPLATRLRRALGPWSVSGPAAAVGAVALADDAWARAARTRLTAGSSRLDGLLMRTGLRIAGGTSLFRLVEHPRANELFELLARAAILVRRFAEQPAWLRFGIPGDDGAFDRLSEALAAWRPQAVAPARSPAPQRLRPAAAGRGGPGQG